MTNRAPVAASTGSASVSASPADSFGPHYEQSLKTTVRLPSRWAGGGGWRIADPSASVFGLKHSVAVIPKSWTGSPSSPVHTLATISTYDQHGNQIAASKVPSGMSSSNLSGLAVGTSYSGGKAYLIMVQYGAPAGGDGAANPSAVHYVVIEDESGKIVADSVFTTPEPIINTEGKIPGLAAIQMDGESVSFLTNRERYVINPATGSVDTITPPSQEYRWMKRVDGVDIYQKGMDGGLSGTGWQIPEGLPFTHGGYTDPNSTVPAFGPYLSVGDSCQRTINVHTGATAAGFEKINGNCDSTSLSALPGSFYRGVVAGTANWYLRPADGTFVQLSGASPFVAYKFAGADGIIYGATDRPTMAAAHLDLSEGVVKADLPAGSAAPEAVTADGLAVFADTTDFVHLKGLIFVNPAAK